MMAQRSEELSECLSESSVDVEEIDKKIDSNSGSSDNEEGGDAEKSSLFSSQHWPQSFL